jgi:hypothetical protein
MHQTWEANTWIRGAIKEKDSAVPRDTAFMESGDSKIIKMIRKKSFPM